MKPPSRLVSLSDMDDFGGIGVPKVLLKCYARQQRGGRGAITLNLLPLWNIYTSFIVIYRKRRML